jgi:hypothetical protein
MYYIYHLGYQLSFIMMCCCWKTINIQLTYCNMRNCWNPMQLYTAWFRLDWTSMLGESHSLLTCSYHYNRKDFPLLVVIFFITCPYLEVMPADNYKKERLGTNRAIWQQHYPIYDQVGHSSNLDNSLSTMILQLYTLKIWPRICI